MLTAIAWLDLERTVYILLLFCFTWKQLQEYKESNLVLSVMASFQKDVKYLPIKDIAFMSAKGKNVS